MTCAVEIIATFKKVITNKNIRFYNGTHLSIKEFQHIVNVFKDVELVIVVDFTPSNTHFLGGKKRTRGCEGIIFKTDHIKGAHMYSKNDIVINIVRGYIIDCIDTNHECPLCCTDCAVNDLLYCSTCFYKVFGNSYTRIKKCPACRIDNAFMSMNYINMD